MRSEEIAAGFLRGVGLLLIVLGIVHTMATPHIRDLLGESSSEVYQRAVGPTLLNHVLMGILLLPLGYTTWLAAAAENRHATWARRVLMVNGIVLLTLPASVAVFMRRPEYYTAPLFLTGVILVTVISLLTIVAAWLVRRSGRYQRKRCNGEARQEHGE
jgi:cytochrome bd-type quinol oxidase subunit 1